MYGGGEAIPGGESAESMVEMKPSKESSMVEMKLCPARIKEEKMITSFIFIEQTSGGTLAFALREKMESLAPMLGFRLRMWKMLAPPCPTCCPTRTPGPAPLVAAGSANLLARKRRRSKRAQLGMSSMSPGVPFATDRRGEWTQMTSRTPGTSPLYTWVRPVGA